MSALTIDILLSPIELDVPQKYLQGQTAETPAPEVSLPKRQTDYLQGGEARTLVKNEIEKLVDNVKDIERNFAAISRNMKALDQLELFSDIKGTPITFHPEWEKLHDVFNSSLIDVPRLDLTLVPSAIYKPHYGF